jgi:hypothetical protein
MSKAVDTSTTSRRRLLAAAPPAVLALSSTAFAAPATINPDAELIGLCAKFEVLERKVEAAFASLTIESTDAEEADANAINDAIHHEQAPIVAAITARRPATLVGFTALANIAVMINPMLVDGAPTDGDYSNRLIRVMLRGMTGRAAA